MRPFRLSAEYQNAILSHDLKGDHHRAVILMIHWLDLLPNVFPHMISRPDPEKDPRRTHLFKCCLKAIQILGPKFPESSLRIFAKSQLQMLRAVEGNFVVVTPECLCGAKAKDRFELWKKKLEEKTVGISAKIPQEEVTADLGNVLALLKNSHKAVVARGGMKKILENRERVARWAKVKVIEPLYIYLHPESQSLAAAIGWAALGVDVENVEPMSTQLVRKTMGEIIK